VNGNVTFPNAEFWYMNYGSNYQVMGTLMQAKIGANCQPSINQKVMFYSLIGLKH